MGPMHDTLLPKHLPHLRKEPERASPLLIEAAAGDAAKTFKLLKTSAEGLSEPEAQRRLDEHGPNAVAQPERHVRISLAVKACLNPLVVLLALLAGVSFATGDAAAGAVMSSMVVLGVVLRFVQESRANSAAAKLKAMIIVTAMVVREGRARELPLAALVPGDVVQFAAGDLGTSVESGEATAVVVETGFRYSINLARFLLNLVIQHQFLSQARQGSLAMPAQMTLTAWGQGIKNALICGMGFLVSWCAIAAAISLIFDQPRVESSCLAFAGLWSLVWLAFLISWLHGRSVAGDVLLDCGPHPTRYLFLMQAILFLFLGLTGGLVASWPVSRVFVIGGTVFGITFAVYWLIMATGRLQIRENGIWQYWSLLKWGKIGSFHWASDSTLLMRAKGPLSWFQGALPVPPEHKQAVDEFLAKRSPQRAPA